MSFYPDVKAHMSPSAHQQWHRQRSAFVKSYFEGEKIKETAAMKTGTAIHRLIEAGLMPAKKVYDQNERELTHYVNDTFKVFGKPDSFESKPTKNTVEFVDYKSGKASEWADKLPTDIKMLTTAWLVWMETGKPEAVIGHIEFFQTTWDPKTKEVVPIEGHDSEVTSYTYQRIVLEEFTEVIKKTMHEVNELYERWKDRTAEFVDEDDCKELARLTAEKDKIDEKITKVKERIQSQMEFGGLPTHKIDGIGTFSVTEKKTYSYPANLKIYYRDHGLTLEDYLEAEKCAKAAKKNFELANEPISTATSMSFRPVKK